MPTTLKTAIFDHFGSCRPVGGKGTGGRFSLSVSFGWLIEGSTPGTGKGISPKPLVCKHLMDCIARAHTQRCACQFMSRRTHPDWVAQVYQFRAFCDQEPRFFEKPSTFYCKQFDFVYTCGVAICANSHTKAWLAKHVAARCRNTWASLRMGQLMYHRSRSSLLFLAFGLSIAALLLGAGTSTAQDTRGGGGGLGGGGGGLGGGGGIGAPGGALGVQGGAGSFSGTVGTVARPDRMIFIAQSTSINGTFAAGLQGGGGGFGGGVGGFGGGGIGGIGGGIGGIGGIGGFSGGIGGIGGGIGGFSGGFGGGIGGIGGGIGGFGGGGFGGAGGFGGGGRNF
jgi:hypothetical protein